MVFRLDPHYPVVWRSPDSLQVGVDSPLLVLDGLTVAQEKLVAALASGINRSGLDMIARSSGGTIADVERVLAAVEPALRGPEQVSSPSVAVHGTGPTAELLTQHLSGRLGGTDLVVVVATFVLEPELHARWLRDDIPHLPVVFGDSVVRIGPFIEPGAGPCLYCLELHRRDADPAWPAIATQLLGRRSPAESALVAGEVAALVTRLVVARLDAGPADHATRIELDLATGERVLTEWVRHPDCQCSELRSGELSPARPGTATVSALRRGRHRGAPRTGEVAASLA